MVNGVMNGVLGNAATMPPVVSQVKLNLSTLAPAAAVAEYTYNGRNQLHQTKVENNPHFPALRSGPLAQGLPSGSKLLAARFVLDTE